MKVLFLSSYVNPGTGASILMRLATRLKQDGHEVLILTTQTGYDSNIIKSVSFTKVENLINGLLHKIVPNYFSLSYNWLMNEAQQFCPDVINVHWTHGRRTIPLHIIPELVKAYPVLWTLHDFWPISANEFVEFVNEKTLTKTDRVSKHKQVKWGGVGKRWLLPYKIRLMGQAHIHTISPSKWLYKKVAASPVFRSAYNHHIPNGVDVNVFKPLNRPGLRERYCIPKDRKVILFLSANLTLERKGFYYFAKAIEHLNTLDKPLVDNISVLLVGENSKEANQYIQADVINYGCTRDVSRLVEYYNLADVFVSASLADNFPSTSLESLACGTPSVAFAVGGIPEIVKEGETGLLSPCYDAESLGRNIQKILTDAALYGELGNNSRNYAVKQFSMDRFVANYLECFKGAVENT